MYNVIYVRLRKLQNGLHVFLPGKGVFPTTDQLSLWERKKRPWQWQSFLLMGDVWLKKKKLFDIVPIYSYWDQEEAAYSGNLESVSKLENVANTNKEWTYSRQLLSPGRGRAEPDGLFHPRFRWSTTEPGWLGKSEMQFGNCFIK